MKSLLAFARRIGYLTFNVGAALQLPKAKNTLAERILQESEVHQMFALEPNPRNRLILKTLYYAGLRVSELCSLRWKGLQARGEEGQITVFAKGKKTRAVLLPTRFWSELLSFRGEAGEDDPVFPFSGLVEVANGPSFKVVTPGSVIDSIAGLPALSLDSWGFRIFRRATQ